MFSSLLSILFLWVTVSSNGIQESTGEIAATNQAMYTAAGSLLTIIENHWQPLVVLMAAMAIIWVFTMFTRNH